MDWSEVVEAAQAIGWVAYLGTADGQGRPHVAAVAPGFGEGSIWFGTRPGSKKLRNLRENSRCAFHWPVGSGGPGELIARGSASIWEDAAERDRIWRSGVMGYDLAGFWTGPDDPDLAFVEVAVTRARLLTLREGRAERREWVRR